ncbi:MAG TPA: hypothetical protein VJM83_06460, partial [Nitrospirota bacterium]|nr:hypothetical protein [Nitrospirota bacterium]
MTDRKSWLILAAAGFVSASLLAGAVKVLSAGWWLANPSLHSTVEALGAMAAILTAVFLLLKEREAVGGKTLSIALGFLGMGLLDGFHAASPPGNSFILLHSVAVLAGGAWFATTWLPRPERLARFKAPLVAAAAASAA